MTKPIFERHLTDYTKTAFMNWRFFNDDSPKSFFTLGEGYLKSALELIENSIIKNEDKRADIFIFPLLHNYNHGIELYLKGLIWTLNLLLNNNRLREGSHNIHQLFDTLKARVSKYNDGKNLKYFNTQFKPLKAYIDELYTHTHGNDKNDQMDFSRYPLNKDNDEHFYIISGENIEIDLINLYERFQEIYKILDQAEDFFYWIEYKKDV